MLVLFVLACGPSQQPGAPDVAQTVAPAEAPSAEVTSLPVHAPGEGTCEAELHRCGGWGGCVHVARDPGVPELIGIGANAGSFYSLMPECTGADCYQVCTGGSLSACRPPVTNSASAGALCVMSDSLLERPHQAPFTCELVDGACVQGPDPMSIPAS